MAALLEIQNFSYTYPGAPAPALDDVSLAVNSGECVCITGHSGCGKTTLLLAVKGLLYQGTASGTITIGLPGTSSNGSTAGMVLQNAESQILCTAVSEEVAFGPENLCVPEEEIGGRVERALEAVGLQEYSGRAVEQLSLGQKQRLAIASVLSMQPQLLLLDEPTSQLDGPGKEKLVRVLAELKSRGHALLITEHDTGPLRNLAARFVTMENGAVTGETGRAPERAAPEAMPSSGRPSAGSACSLAARNLSLAYTGTGEVLRNLNITVSRGELIHLFGCNGAGKSSFLRCITGFLTPQSGEVETAGIAGPRPEQLLGKVGFLFQNPQRQLFEESVFAEVCFSLKRMQCEPEEARQRVMKALRLCGVDHLASRSPLTLSFGEQHRVTLASVLAPQPELLLLDEPFAGLDFAQRHKILSILSELRSRCGTTVVIVSHDQLPDPRWADRMLVLENGTIECK
jgi:energy-coupling factor transport system ATP-binding protein